MFLRIQQTTGCTGPAASKSTSDECNGRLILKIRSKKRAGTSDTAVAAADDDDDEDDKAWRFQPLKDIHTAVCLLICYRF